MDGAGRGATEDAVVDDEIDCCGQPLTFDPNLRGTTCGGLDRIGWDVCSVCGVAYVSRQGRDAAELEWRVAKGGRSITAGSFKIRCEGGDAAQVKALMERLVRVPQLEAELDELRRKVGG